MERLKVDKAMARLVKAIEHLAKNRLQEAIQAAEEALATFREAQHQQGKEDAMNVLVRARVAEGQTDAALQALRDALALYQGSGDKRGQAATLRTLTTVLVDQGAAQEARSSARDLLEAYRALDDRPGQGLALRALLALHGHTTGGTGAALEALQEWLAHARSLGDRRAEAVSAEAALRWLAFEAPAGGASASAGARKAAAELGEQALAIYRELGDQPAEADLLDLVAKAQSARGDVAGALDTADEEVRVFKELNDAQGQVRALLTKASVHLDAGELGEAAQVTDEALSRAREAGAKRAEIEALTLLSRLHFARWKPDAASETASEAVGLAKKMLSKRDAAALTAALVKVVLDAGKPQEALSFVQDALALHHISGDARGLAVFLRDSVASANVEVANTDKAVEMIETALRVFQALGDTQEEASTLYRLAQVHHDAGSQEDALKVAEDLIGVCAKHGKRTFEADADHLVAYLHFRAGEYTAALSSAERALASFRRSLYVLSEVQVLESILRIHLSLDNMEAVMRVTEELRGIAAGMGDRARVAQAAQVLVGIRLSKQDYAGVLRDAKTDLEASRQSEDAYGEAQQWLAIASARAEQLQAPATEGAAAQDPSRTRKRAMEALMAAKEAVSGFQRLDAGAGEAAALQALAKVYYHKCDHRLAVEAAKQAATVSRASGDMYSVAQALLLEAIALLGLAGAVQESPDEEAELGLAAAPEKEALAAAQEAWELCQKNKDWDMEEYALMVLEGARDCFRLPFVPQPPRKHDILMAFDLGERNVLEDLGFRFKSPVDALDLLRSDPRLAALLPQKSVEMPLQPKADLAMDRLQGIAAHAQATLR